MLGDLVGYGAEPNAVIDRVLALAPLMVIRGQSRQGGMRDRRRQLVQRDRADRGDVDDGDADGGEPRVPAGAAGRSRSRSTRPSRSATARPFDEDHYIFDSDDASRALDSATRPLCLFGHTHLPVVFLRTATTFDGFVPDSAEDVDVLLERGTSYLINVGSVGQPRDGDPRAAFGIYDSADTSLRLRRVAYPIAQAQRRILDAGLPPSLANRLSIGR